MEDTKYKESFKRRQVPSTAPEVEKTNLLGPRDRQRLGQELPKASDLQCLAVVTQVCTLGQTAQAEVLRLARFPD